MDFSKTCSKHQVGITNIKKWLDNHSMCYKEKNLMSNNHTLYKENLKWNCLDCGLMLTSELQAQEHFLGRKHQNVIKNKAFGISCSDTQSAAINLSPQFSTSRCNMLLKRKIQGAHTTENFPYNYMESKNNIHNIIPPSAGRDNILETVIKNDRRKFSSADLSVYRTPSGKYYCQSCDLTVNSQAQFLQHSESRRHRHKSNRNCKLK